MPTSPLVRLRRGTILTRAIGNPLYSAVVVPSGVTFEIRIVMMEDSVPVVSAMYMSPFSSNLCSNHIPLRLSRPLILVCTHLLTISSQKHIPAQHAQDARSKAVGSKPSFHSEWRKRQLVITPVEALHEPNYESVRAGCWKTETAEGEPPGIAGIFGIRQ
jgi:hypothetical protein